MQKTHFVGLLYLCIYVMSCQSSKKLPVYWQNIPAKAAIQKETNTLKHLYYQFLGHFSTKPYVDANPEVKDLLKSSVNVPILQDRVGEYWLYNEVFAHGYHERPFLSRVMKVTRLSRDTFAIYSYGIKDAEKYMNEWLKEKPFEDFSTDELIESEGCVDYLIEMDKRYVFKTTSDTTGRCKNVFTYGGYAGDFLRYDIQVQDDRFIVKSYSYDAKGKLIRAPSSAEGSHFMRVDPNDEDYRLDKKKEEE